MSIINNTDELETKPVVETTECYEYVKNTLTAHTRTEELEGIEYIVVPMVMLVEGVVNGSNGAILYTAKEMAKAPITWNMRPVLVKHPLKGITASDQEIINTQKIGVIMNAKFEDSKLKAEAWIDPARCQVVDNRVYDAIVRNEIMEVSTGLFTGVYKKMGIFNNREYRRVACNFVPDHLAILPDEIGACSVADGAGLMRLNSANREHTSTVEDADDILTKVTSMEKQKLIGDIIALLQSPIKNLVGSLQSGQNTLSGLVKTLSEKE